MSKVFVLDLRRCSVAATLTLFILLFTASSALAQTVTLVWTPNTETNIAGYTLLVGPSSGNYVRQIDVGLKTTYVVTGLDRTQNNYFAVEAYTTDGLVSPPSQEALLPANPSSGGTTISNLTSSVAAPFLVGTPVT